MKRAEGFVLCVCVWEVSESVWALPVTAAARFKRPGSSEGEEAVFVL